MRTLTGEPATEHEVTIYLSVEISAKSWVVGVNAPHSVEKISLHKIDAGNVEALMSIAQRASLIWERGHGRRPRILVCYEAGYEGFWLARALEAYSVETIVIDPSSLLVNRKARRAKTDRIDARQMVRALRAYDQGDPHVLRIVRIPTIEEEDRKRLLRARIRLVKERTALSNAIKGLLKLHGVYGINPRSLRFEEKVTTVKTGYGEPLPPRVRAEIFGVKARFSLVEKQIADIEAERDDLVKRGESRPTQNGAPTTEGMMASLTQLKGVGSNDAAMLAHEVFYRKFENRRELANWAGLTPMPWKSGDVEYSQGIGKDGPTRIRVQLLQLAWRWLRYQPDSALSEWFYERTQGTKGRMRRILVVALARKLLVALWRYATTGLVPEGARFA